MVPARPGDATYLQLLESMPVMLWTADAQGVWHHINYAWAEYTGLTGDTPGFGFEESLHPDDVAPTLSRWRAAVSARRPYEIEYRLRARDGSYRVFLIRGRPVQGQEEQPFAWVGTCTDIDAQKRAEQQALDAREAAVRALGLALEARDDVTMGHTDRVTGLALRLGQRLSLGQGQLEALRLGAYLHDIGKMAVPDAALHKPGPLNEDEWVVMRRHASEGARFAQSLGFLPTATLELIRHHHEHWDGSGYPSGLRGADIPVLARVFAVVDVYDALISERPYKPAWSKEAALTEVHALAGSQFDPQVTAAFAEMVGRRAGRAD
ncbi:HD domain-containing phosphohydrolase [Deinococcus hohokamensis]|uniref:HD domain-containing phosphohydrolase n=1 Tax=Deinococcus hohokamensis TaxID=309883 RepID=A0ABV9IBB1_9DEIO